MNIALITARGGSKSIPQKNLLKVSGKPLVRYAADAAFGAKLVGAVFVDTDSFDIAGAVGAFWLQRPAELCGDLVNHGDVIKHAVLEVQSKLAELQNVVVLLGNTVMVDSALIDQALELLEARPGIDSVMSVWEAQDDHPFRALELGDMGILQPFWADSELDEDVSTARQTYPKVYFYDQGVWAFRWQNVLRRGRIRPWWWMGDVCLPIVRPWIAGRDVHGMLDVEIAEWWVRRRRNEIT